MRRILVSLAMCLWVLPAAASPATDLQRVVDHYLTEDFMEGLRSVSAKEYAKLYREMLREHSVYQLDVDRFAAMLPPEITDDRLIKLKDVLISECYAKLEPQDIDVYVRAIEAGDTLSRVYDGTDVQSLELKMGFCVMFTVLLHLDEKMEPVEMLPQKYNADVARILATPGIARFPNRIVRQDILRKFQ